MTVLRFTSAFAHMLFSPVLLLVYAFRSAKANTLVAKNTIQRDFRHQLWASGRYWPQTGSGE
jgi:hypothetical protein